MKRFLLSTLCAALVVALAVGNAVAASQTLETVKKRGHLICGVNTGLTGFSVPDDKGVWKGFDVDYCRAAERCGFRQPRQGRLQAPHGQDALSGASVE